MIFINAIVTFGLCFLTHFLYEWIPNPIFAVFFPVNESIWEHMKMLYTTILIYGIIEHWILKRANLHVNNFSLTTIIKSIISIPIYLIIFIPLYNLFGENMFISISVLFIVLLIVNFIGYKIYDTNEIDIQKPLSIVIIILVYALMIYLTYYPPHTELFYDIKEEKYGINEYVKK